MGKGTQTGSATGSTVNPAGAALLPYAEGGWKEAARIAQDPTQYPNYVPPNPMTVGGYQDVYNTGQNLTQGFLPPVNNAYMATLPGYGNIGAGGSGPQQTLDNVVNYGVNSALGYASPTAGFGNRAAALGEGYGSTIAGYANRATGGNLGLSQLGDVASGKFTDASSNPYLRDMVNAALRPVSENYQTSTAPTLDARFSAGGRYGSGAADQAAATARDAFARNAGEISTGMYGRAYESERGRQDTAAQQYDAAIRAGLGLGITGDQAAAEAARMGLATGISGNQAAGNLVDQGLRTVTGAAAPNLLAQLSGLGGELSAVNAYPQLAGAQFLGPQAAIKSGDYFRGEELAPYNSAIKRVQDYMTSLGNAPNAGSSTTQPIFGNPLTSALSGATGVLGLGKELGIGSAASSLFGGGGAAATTAGLGALFPGAAASALPAYAAALPEVAAGASAFAPAAAAALTIVCTELVRQGRMPDPWRRAGMRQFMRYPAIARRGYWVWATPVVAHLRRQPDSRFSKIIERTFNWRAEDLAARNGVKGARRLIRGRLVTAAMVIPCLACGLMTTRDYFPGGKDAPA